MWVHEFLVELTVDGVVYGYKVQVEPWGEFKIYPDKFNAEENDRYAELVATKANPTQYEKCEEYEVWFNRRVNSFHERLISDGVKSIPTPVRVPKKVHKKVK
jgi:hypothetical protein